jgi:hypothetical protein
LNTKDLSDSRAKVPAIVNLAFNVNIEFLSLGTMNMRCETLSTLTKVLSTIDASNHIHYMALCVEPLYGFPQSVDWPVWEEVYSLLAGPRFQFLRVLRINIRRRHNVSNLEAVIQTIQNNMVAARPSLATRGARVSLYDLVGSLCLCCSDDPWQECPRI